MPWSPDTPISPYLLRRRFVVYAELTHAYFVLCRMPIALLFDILSAGRLLFNEAYARALLASSAAHDKRMVVCFS